jgi:hypothetical protein
VEVRYLADASRQKITTVEATYPGGRTETYRTKDSPAAAPGCFRCHDGEHVTAAGKAISQDCALCHSLLAVEEVNPKILSELKP